MFLSFRRSSIESLAHARRAIREQNFDNRNDF